MTEERFNELVGKYGRESAQSIRDAANQVKSANGQSVADMINEGTRSIVGDFKSSVEPLEDQKATEDECKSIADFINKGTVDILKYPTAEAREALERGQTIRELQAKIKGE